MRVLFGSILYTARPFRFDRHDEQRLYLHQYGIVTFVRPLPQLFQPLCRNNSTNNTTFILIAPYWADTFTDGGYGGKVYYRLNFCFLKVLIS